MHALGAREARRLLLATSLTSGGGKTTSGDSAHSIAGSISSVYGRACPHHIRLSIHRDLLIMCVRNRINCMKTDAIECIVREMPRGSVLDMPYTPCNTYRERYNYSAIAIVYSRTLRLQLNQPSARGQRTDSEMDMVSFLMILALGDTTGAASATLPRQALETRHGKLWTGALEVQGIRTPHCGWGGGRG